MNLLQLCNRLISEAGISAQPMTTTAGQTGELGRVVNWIQQAWLDIQSAHTTWRWMRKSATIVTAAGQSGGYTAVANDVATWTLDTARNYVTASGNITEVFMNFVEYDDFRDSYLCVLRSHDLWSLRSSQPTRLRLVRCRTVIIP